MKKHEGNLSGKLICLALMIMLLGALTIVGACAETQGTCGDGLTWTLNNEGTLTISGSGYMTSHGWKASDVKQAIVQNGVKNICDKAFASCSKMEAVILPDGLIKIGASAFSQCKVLSNIIIPNGLIEIGDHAFYHCDKLASVVIPESVTVIESNTFAYCGSMTSATIPNSVKSIGSSAFYSCKSLTGITLPSSVTSIGGSAFADCTGLSSFTIPDGVQSIGKSAFSGCINLAGITVPGSVTSIGESAFNGCTMLTGITIPNGVKSIEASTFKNCSNLTGITIPSGVTGIAKAAFSGCSALTEITIPCSVGANAFENCTLLGNVTFLQGTAKIGTSAFSKCYHLKTMTIQASQTTIGDKAFEDCWEIASITIPANNKTAVQWFRSNGLANVLNLQVVDIGTCTVEKPKDQVYTGDPLEPEVVVKFASTKLVKGTDYTASYTNNTNVGTATVTITGMDAYTGIVTSSFSISCADLKNASIAAIPDQVYTGLPLEPEISVTYNSKTLMKGMDYTVSFVNNTNAGKATVNITGMGNFTGSVTGSFKILGVDISTCTVTAIPDQTYTGVPIEPKIEVICGSTILAKGTDYSVDFENNINAGRAKVTVTGTGNYRGDKQVFFNIVMIPDPIDVSGAEISSICDQVYSGKPIRPKLTVKINGKTLNADIDYTVVFVNNKNIGKATVKITGKGDYTGTKNTTFNIIPKSVALTSLKAGKQSLTVKWKNGSGIDGYEIEYGLKKDFKGAKKITVWKAKSTEYEIKKLKAKKTYYVRIRAFKKVKGKKYYSEWSNVLKKKIK